MDKLAKFRVIICWMDGHEDPFDCIEVGIENNCVELYIADGWYRHIPLMNIRWYDTCVLPSDEDNETNETDNARDEPLTFPCEYKAQYFSVPDIIMSNLSDCSECSHNESCDTYITMMAEEHDENRK